MVKKFLWETNGTVPFKGQCFLLSDFLQWARNINGSEVLHFIINLFEKNNFEKSLFFFLQDASLRAFNNFPDMFLREGELVFIERLASTSEKEAYNAFKGEV